MKFTFDATKDPYSKCSDDVIEYNVIIHCECVTTGDMKYNFEREIQEVLDKYTI